MGYIVVCSDSGLASGKCLLYLSLPHVGFSYARDLNGGSDLLPQKSKKGAQKESQNFALCSLVIGFIVWQI